ncbi:MAG: hypothetical protein U9R16_00405 [Campylobacterota bacterium]|nr:hypothetical protein [Campylobacterota bacterium]
MSSYRRITLFIVLVFIFISCTKQYASTESIKKIDYKEDLFMLLALDSENHKKYNDSYNYYKNLYQLNPKEIYIKKTIAYSYKLKNYEQMQLLSLEAEKTFPKSKEYFTQQSIIAFLGQQKIEIALDKATELLKEFKSAKNYEIMANVYYVKKDYKNSLKYYESAYAQNQNIYTLVKLTTILYTYLDKKDIALAYLETFLQEKGCNAVICDRLMLIYQEQGNINGMLSILNKLHFKYSKDPSLKKSALMIQNIIVSLLEKKDINEAIKYLEKHNINNIKLLNLYEQYGQLEKALKLTRIIYKKNRKPELLGKIAMLQFEIAEDKKKVMKHVIANFELALSSGINNASFQNYYGYLLIDFDIDVKKGIRLVKQALKTTPNNLAYLDSLAWGYYKINRCKEALEIMQKVIAQTGLKDEEIKLHWEKIKNCKKLNKGKNKK